MEDGNVQQASDPAYAAALPSLRQYESTNASVYLLRLPLIEENIHLLAFFGNSFRQHMMFGRFTNIRQAKLLQHFPEVAFILSRIVTYCVN